MNTQHCRKYLKEHHHLKPTVEFHWEKEADALSKISIILAALKKVVIKLKYSLAHSNWRQLTYVKGQTPETQRK